MSGLTPLERTWCAYLLIGPSGTGRVHLARTVARTLCGHDAVPMLNCNPGGHAEPSVWFVQQLESLLAESRAQRQAEGPPHIILVQDLERAHKELFPVLARVLETGQLKPARSGHACLDNCILFFTSGLCADEILNESSRIGFSGSSVMDDQDVDDEVAKLCRAEAQNTFGSEFLAQLDNLIIFRKLGDDDLAQVLDRHSDRMNRWLGQRGLRCEMLPAARDFLLVRASVQDLLGARHLIQVHRREVEFPVADLLLSGKLGPGGIIRVDHRQNEDHLHFTVQIGDPRPVGSSGLHEIPVQLGAI